MNNEDWCICPGCKKWYALPLRDIHLRTDEKPLRCPYGHVLTYYPNGVNWQQLTGIYYLLSSLYITMPKAISFAQFEELSTIIAAAVIKTAAMLQEKGTDQPFPSL